MTGLPCPNCGSELAFLEQYRRHYCYACGQYAPQGFGDEGAKICPSCGGILAYVGEYNRYYCYRESAFPAEDATLKSIYDTVSAPPTPEAESSTEPTVLVSEPPKGKEPAATVVETPATVVETPADPPREPEQRTEEEIPPEEPTPERPKQPLNRVKIFQAKKTTLLDLCKDYNLDPTGTKEQLRERLLSYLDTLEAEAQPKEVPREEAPAQQEEPPTEEVPASSTQTRAATTQAAESQPVAEETPQEEAPKDEPAPTLASAAVVETEQPAQTIIETASTGSTATPSETQPSFASAPVIEQARRMHPCPTCGRELTYIALYRRWYCYHCRAYAPVGKSKFACPNCGATLRWIAQYERWWCDACRRYAPAELPKPEAEATSAAVTIAATVAQPAAQVATLSTTAIVHRHRSPGSGIGLVGFGIVLFVLYEVLVDLPNVLSYRTGITVSPNLAFGLRFFAFVFVAVGAIMGLSAVRDRR